MAPLPVALADGTPQVPKGRHRHRSSCRIHGLVSELSQCGSRRTAIVEPVVHGAPSTEDPDDAAARFLDEADDVLARAREAANRLGREPTPGDLQPILSAFEHLRANAVRLDLSDIAEMGDLGLRLASAVRARRLPASRAILGVLFRCLDATHTLVLAHRK
jgi:hypothetical protein